LAERPLVPSSREVESGMAAASAAPIVAPEQQRTLWNLGQTIRDLRMKEVTRGRPKAPIVVMALFAMLTRWDDDALGVLLPEMRAEFGFDLQFLITLGSVLGIVSLLLAPLMGYLADRASRVWMIRVGALLANVFSGVTGLATGIPMLIAGRIGTGLGASISAPAGGPLLADYYPSHSRARVFASLGVAGAVGGIIGGPLAGILGESFGWRFAVILLAVVATVISLAAFVLREVPRGYTDRVEMGLDEAEARVEQEPVGWSETWRATRSIATMRRLWYATPFLQVGGTLLLTLLGQYYAEVFGAGARTRGAIVAISSAVGLIALLISGPIADRIIENRPGKIMTIMGWMLVMQSLMVVGLAASPSLWISVAITVPMTFASALFLPALFSLITLTVPARIRGLGLQTIAPWQLVGFVLVAALGSFADEVGLRTGMLALIPMFLVAAYILGTGAPGVARDIQAARAAAIAEAESVEARRRGRSKQLVCRDVQVSYDGVQVLFGVDLDVEAGEIIALLGTNGAGKSTLLRAIAGIQQASGGAIFFDGRDITHLPPHLAVAEGIVMVPGGRGVLPTMSVMENLEAATWLFQDEGTKDRIANAFALFPRLEERAGEPAGALSGGEQQMLAIAQALVMRPKLLMIDELSIGLSPAIVTQLLGVVREISRTGTTVIVVEQSVNVALLLAERAVFMQKGEVRFSGPTAELLERRDIMQAVFLGKAPAASMAPVRRDHQSTEKVLSAENLSISFGGISALHDVSLSMEAGEVVGIIGPNGAGKTTLFDALSGVVHLDTGMVMLGATDVTAMSSDARARLGMGRLFQNSRLFPSLTARETITVAMHRHLTGGAISSALWSPESRKQERRAARRVSELILLLGLEAYADKYLGDLSVGTKRVVDIACALASRPSVLLLDEPSSGLSQAEAEQLGPLLIRLRKDTGCGMLMIEHDMGLVTSVSDRLIAMHLGEVLVQGTPTQVVGDQRVIESYLGTSEEVINRSTAMKGS